MTRTPSLLFLRHLLCVVFRGSELYPFSLFSHSVPYPPPYACYLRELGALVQLVLWLPDSGLHLQLPGSRLSVASGTSLSLPALLCSLHHHDPPFSHAQAETRDSKVTGFLPSTLGSLTKAHGFHLSTCLHFHLCFLLRNPRFSFPRPWGYPSSCSFPSEDSSRRTHSWLLTTRKMCLPFPIELSLAMTWALLSSS